MSLTLLTDAEDTPVKARQTNRFKLDFVVINDFLYRKMFESHAKVLLHI